MDFDFKKSRKNKQRQDKVRSLHQHHPDQKSKQNNDRGHVTPLKTGDKPASYTATDPVQFQHLKRETEDITSTSETKSYSRRVVVSNWEKYELPPDSPEELTEEALDFETLVNSLSDVKGHLILSHEQTWGSERSELQEVFFNIDMHKLCTSLQRVPYHIRQKLSPSLFTSEQLAIFERDAEEAQKEVLPKKISETTCNLSLTEQDSYAKSLSNISMTSATLTKTSGETGDPGSVKGLPSNTTSEVVPNQAPECISLPKVILSAEQPIEDPSPVVSSRNDELDLDFLLSLDAAVPDKTEPPLKAKDVSTSVLGGVQVSQTSKLDAWLDDLLDD